MDLVIPNTVMLPIKLVYPSAVIVTGERGGFFHTWFGDSQAADSLCNLIKLHCAYLESVV